MALVGGADAQFCSLTQLSCQVLKMSSKNCWWQGLLKSLNFHFGVLVSFLKSKVALLGLLLLLCIKHLTLYSSHLPLFGRSVFSNPVVGVGKLKYIYWWRKLTKTQPLKLDNGWSINHGPVIMSNTRESSHPTTPFSEAFTSFLWENNAEVLAGKNAWYFYTNLFR